MQQEQTKRPRINTEIVTNRVGWLVGCFGFNGPLRQYFSLYRAVTNRVDDILGDKLSTSSDIDPVV